MRPGRGWGVRWAGLQERVKPRLVATLGRTVRCEACGERLFRGVPFVWAGRLRVLGAEEALVRVEWETWNRLAFRHAELDRCRARR